MKPLILTIEDVFALWNAVSQYTENQDCEEPSKDLERARVVQAKLDAWVMEVTHA